MIDKDGKLFGKINIIDLLILVVVAAALILFGVRALGRHGSGSVAGETQTVRITFFGSEVPEYLPDSLTVGDPVSQYNTEIGLGTLVEFSHERAYEYIYDAQTGKAVKKPIENLVFLTFTCDAVGTLDSNGFTAGDTTFVVGGNYFINVGPTRAGYQIKSFELIG